MLEISEQPIRIFLDFNAVIVNLDSLSPENQQECLRKIEENVMLLKSYLEDNIHTKEQMPEIPETGKAVLQQQYQLAQSMETWVHSIKAGLEK